jgi:hypothetical protein
MDGLSRSLQQVTVTRETPGVMDISDAAPPAAASNDGHRAFLLSPPPRGSRLTECTVERHKNTFASTAYELRIDGQGGAGTGQGGARGGAVVASSRKCRQPNHASYKIACGGLRQDASSYEFVGKLKSNGPFNGEYT